MSSTILVLKITSWMMMSVIRMRFNCYLQSHYLWGWISPKLVPSSEKDGSTCLLPRIVERREWSIKCRTSMSGKAPSTVRMAFSIVIGGFDHLSFNVLLLNNHHNSIFINLLSRG